MPSIKVRAGMRGGPLSTKEPSTSSDPVDGNVSKRGKYFNQNQARPIDNSVAVQPRNVGASKVDNAVSWPGKFKY